MPKLIDLTGKRFGKWTVLEYAGDCKWLCRCGCGLVKTVDGGDLRREGSTRCKKCTAKYFSELYKGRKLSEKHKKKIAKSNKGQKRSEETCSNIGKASKRNWGDPEFRERVCTTHRNIENSGRFPDGKDHPNWKGGTQYEPYNSEFNKELKFQIRKRDNFICQECHYTEKEFGYILRIHHIDYNKKNNDPDNLIALCRSCHSQTNFNREDWTEYFKSKLFEGIR